MIYQVPIRLLLLAHLFVQIALELRHFLFKPLVDSLLDYLTDDLHYFDGQVVDPRRIHFIEYLDDVLLQVLAVVVETLVKRLLFCFVL